MAIVLATFRAAASIRFEMLAITDTRQFVYVLTTER